MAEFLTIIDGGGEKYRTVGVSVQLLVQSVDHPERPPVWIDEKTLRGIREIQPELSLHRAALEGVPGDEG